MDPPDLKELADRLEKTEKELAELKEQNDRIAGLLEKIALQWKESITKLTAIEKDWENWKSGSQVKFNTVITEKLIVS